MKSAEVIRQAADPKQWDFFAEFIKWEKAVGGPDPHMKLVGAMNEDRPWIERAWAGGCYVGVYNAPTAEVLWTQWPIERVLAESGDLEPWIDQHWKGLAFRRERRAARSAKKLSAFMVSYANWITTAREMPWWTEDYDAAWKAGDDVYSVGRYIKLKMLEYLRRYCEAPFQLEDLRAKGGWSPRTALCLLYSDHAPALLGDDSKENVVVAERLTEKTAYRLIEEYGLYLDSYELQVLLCDYKQSYSGRRQFPGRSQDSELAYYRKISPYWNHETKMFETRARIFPHVALGEIQGWSGVREELGGFLRMNRLTWSDFLYDYTLTSDLRDPVPR
jgi:hypothetical protein